MADFNEKKLRLLIVVVFVILIFLPLFFISHNLSNLATAKFNEEMAVAGKRFVENVSSFKKSLIPRQYVENLIKKGEAEVGLVAQTTRKPFFVDNVDPQLFTSNTNTRLRQFYHEKCGLQPLYQLAFAVDCRQIWPWYNSHLAHLSLAQRQSLDTISAIFTIDEQSLEPVMTGDPLALRNFNELLNLVLKSGMSFSISMLSQLYDIFSDFAYAPKTNGVAYFILFGFPRFMRLLLRILTVTSLVLLLPYLLLGHFCFGLLTSFQNLEQHELRVEAEGLMYRLKKILSTSIYSLLCIP